jgi:AcrR family transcriptional regulator
MARKPAQTKLPDVILDAALALAAERPWDEVRLGDIAERAGVSLSDLRAAYDGKTDILAAFTRRIDRAVLDRIDPDLGEEPVRERLFDVLMSRFDALMPYREAVRSIAKSFERRPGDLIAWNPVAVRSMTWMLEAAGIDTGGRLGTVGAQGLAIVFGRTLRVWLRDDDPGMARTMVELDRRLTEGGRWMGRLEGLCSVAGAIGRIRRGRRRRYEAAPPEEELAGSGI